LIPEPLPAGTAIAHKTGTLHDTLNDVGIVYGAGDDPYVIAVMTTDLPTLDAGRRFIRGVSKMAYTALNQLASVRGDDLWSSQLHSVTPSRTTTPDQQMWTPQNVPATASEPEPAQPVATVAPSPN
jgi:hypothetical protein